MGASLSSDRKAFMNGILHHLSYHGMAYMADVNPSSCGPCHIDHILGSNILRPHIMCIKEIPDLFFVCPSFLCFCFSLSFPYLTKFLTVESAKRPVWFQDLQGFADISHIYRREQIPIGAGKSLKSSHTALVQVHQIIHIVFYRTGLVVIISHNAAPQCKIHHRMLADQPQLHVKNFFVHQGRIII